MTTTIIKTFAKVNLSLLVYPLEKSGMHPIYSVFQNISLYDELHISKSDTFQLTSTNKNVPTDTTNLITQIYTHVKNKLNTSFNIHLKKNIPIGGGLGGGSSNAAGFLKFLNTHQNWNLPIEELAQISIPFGSDIAFFLYGGTALVTGIGDTITPIKQKIDQPILLIMPNIQCNTKKIYQSFDKIKKNNTLKNELLKHINKHHIGPNSLKEAIFSTNTLFQELEDFLKNKKLPLQVSGSGACCFVLSESENDCQNLQNTLKKEFPELITQICSPISHGIEVA